MEYLENYQPRKIIVQRSLLGKEYPIIGEGFEGTIYDYNDPQTGENLAIKIFHKYDQDKLEKLGKLCHYKDPNMLFPTGFAHYWSEYPPLGYCMASKEGRPNFDRLHEFNLPIIIYVIIEASKAMRRAHEFGISFGDVKASNILIDKDNTPLYCDTDNLKIPGFNHDNVANRAKWLESIYMHAKEFDEVDSDKFLLALESLKQLSIKGHDNQMGCLFVYDIVPQARVIINSLNILQELKDELMCIISDSSNKPYLDHVFEEIQKLIENDPERPLLIRKK